MVSICSSSPPPGYLQGPALPGVDLEVHHVLEPLVVGGVEEDLGRDLAPCTPPQGRRGANELRRLGVQAQQGGGARQEHCI